MLTVADYELIRRKFFLDGVSQRAIAEELRGTGTRAAIEPAVRGVAELVSVRQPLLQRGQRERERPRGESREAVRSGPS